MTGDHLADRLLQAAWDARIRTGTFLAPLTTQPTKYLRQLRGARQPTVATLERIEALLEGRPVPPPPVNNFQRYVRSEARATYQGDDLSRSLATKAAEAHRLTLSRLASERRLPGETLFHAAKRLERTIQPEGMATTLLPGAAIQGDMQ